MGTWTAGNSLGSAEATAPGTSTKERELEVARMWPGAVVANAGDSHPDLGIVFQTWGQLSRPAAATGWLPSQDQWPLWPRSARGLKTKDLWSDCSPQGDSGLPGNSNVTMTLIIVMPPKTPVATEAQVPAG